MSKSGSGTGKRSSVVINITAYSDLYGMIRIAAADFGIYDIEGNLKSGTYTYQDEILNNAITLMLLKMSNYSKVANENSITPKLANDNDEGYLVYLAALELLIGDFTIAVRTRNLSIAKDLRMKIAKLLGDIKQFSDARGLPYAQDGALEALHDLDNRISDFMADNA